MTGIGLVTPLGMDAGENARALRAGQSGFSPITLFDTSRQRVHSAGQIHLPEDAAAARHWGRTWRHADRGTRMAWFAAREAMSQAGCTGGRMPLVIGTSAAAMPIGEAYYRQAVTPPLRRAGQLRRVQTYQAPWQLTRLSAALGIDGPLRILSNACASGANAIGHGFHLIRDGKADQVLAGGYDALSLLVFAGFDALQALSPSGIPRPFDAGRDGLALGEGAGFLMLESAASAAARGAQPLATLAGYGAATDVHHLTQPHPDGDAALATMRSACAMAGLAPAEIDYINSHGTGTPLNDVAEAHAIARWAGNDVGRIPVSSTKSAMGHLLGGAGAVEAAICLLALDRQWLPANLHVRTPDPACRFDLVTTPRDAVLRTALTNSFGFGGANATLVFRKEVRP